MKMIGFLAALAASQAMVPGASAQRMPDPTAAADVERQRLALELAELLNSEALTRLQLARMMNDTLPKMLTTSPEFAAMEKQYPGIGKAVVDAMAPIILEGTLQRLPDLWRETAPVYAEIFTTDELHQVLAFYRSPLGSKIIRIMGEQSDFAPAMREAMTSPTQEVTEGSLRQALGAGAAALVRELSAEETERVTDFVSTPAGKKISEATPRVQQIAVVWGNRSMPELEARVQAAVMGVLEKYTGKKLKP